MANPEDVKRAKAGDKNLQEADFSWADMSNIDLSGANLHKANLHGARFSGALLVNVNLAEADLTDADLTEAKLAEVNLFRTRYNKRTLWPEGFSPVGLGGYLESSPEIPWPTVFGPPDP